MKSQLVFSLIKNDLINDIFSLNDKKVKEFKMVRVRFSFPFKMW